MHSSALLARVVGFCCLIVRVAMAHDVKGSLRVEQKEKISRATELYLQERLPKDHLRGCCYSR